MLELTVPGLLDFGLDPAMRTEAHRKRCRLGTQ